MTTAAPPPPKPPFVASTPLLIGVGVGAIALLGGALAFDLSGDSTYSQAQAEVMVQSRRTSLYNSANSDRALAQGFLIGGVAAAGVATWMFLFHRHGETPPPATSMRFVASPAGFAVLGGF